MHIHIGDLSGSLLVFLLIFARAGAMIMLLPAIGDMGVPARVRLALALAVSFALLPALAHAYPAAAPSSPMALTVMIAKETTIGVLVGGMARIIMSALNVAGYLIATQTGLAYAQTLDPTQGQQGAIIGTFFSMLGVVMIFATDLHHLAINAIQGSYTLIPPDSELPTGDMAELAIRLVSGSFALGLQLAAPFLVFGFAVNAAIGLLARLMPQLQVFFIAMPINILAGFFLMLLLVGSMMTMFLTYYTEQMGSFQ
ncbi:MAG: flagellar type III secretion system protein FliR [Proteobacteria bacterium]|nr:flagellar type III secretion system protein FliR [Pseudomonadota bacterium]